MSDKDETQVLPAVEPEGSEIDRIDPNGSPITLVSGTEVEIRPLRMREFFKLLRIVTRGGAEILANMRLSLSAMDEDEFVTQFLAVLLFAVPEAEAETEDFLRAMVKPAGLTGNKKKDDALQDALEAELDNPEIEDALTIIEAVVRAEAGDLQALGKRLRAAFNLAERTGQVKAQKKSPQAA